MALLLLELSSPSRTVLQTAAIDKSSEERSSAIATIVKNGERIHAEAFIAEKRDAAGAGAARQIRR